MGWTLFVEGVLLRNIAVLSIVLLTGTAELVIAVANLSFEFLTMEHKNKNGINHRSNRQVAGAWRDAINSGFPDIYTVLCYNCNQAETHGRTCPHKLNRTTILAALVVLKMYIPFTSF